MRFSVSQFFDLAVFLFLFSLYFALMWPPCLAMFLCCFNRRFCGMPHAFHAFHHWLWNKFYFLAQKIFLTIYLISKTARQIVVSIKFVFRCLSSTFCKWTQIKNLRSIWKLKIPRERCRFIHIWRQFDWFHLILYCTPLPTTSQVLVSAIWWERHIFCKCQQKTRFTFVRHWLSKVISSIRPNKID